MIRVQTWITVLVRVVDHYHSTHLDAPPRKIGLLMLAYKLRVATRPSASYMPATTCSIVALSLWGLAPVPGPSASENKKKLLLLVYTS